MKSILGIFLESHLDRQFIKIAFVKRIKKKFFVEKVESYVQMRQTGSVLEEIQALQEKCKTFFLASGLDSGRVLVRKLFLPLKNKKTIYKALPFQLEQQIPYDLEEALVFPLVERSKNGTNVTAFCVKSQIYEKFVEDFSKLGLELQFISCAPQALTRFSAYFFPHVATISFFMGEVETYVASVSENKLEYTQIIPIGKQHLLEALKEDHLKATEEELETLLFQIDLSNLKKIAEESLRRVLEEFLQQLDRVLYYLLKEKKEEVSFLYLGEKHLITQLHKEMEKRQNKEFPVLEIPEEFENLSAFATSIGFAFDALYEDENTVQFRKIEKPPKLLQSIFMKKCGIFAISCLVFSLSLFFSLNLFSNMKQKALENKLDLLVESYLQDDANFDKEKIENKGFFDKLRGVRSHLVKSNKPCGYYVAPERISSILEKISETLFLFSEKGIAFSKFTYDLEEFPSIEQPEKEYKICAKLVVQAEKEEDATEFFKAALESFKKQKVQLKPEIKKIEDMYEAEYLFTAAE